MYLGKYADYRMVSPGVRKLGCCHQSHVLFVKC